MIIAKTAAVVVQPRGTTEDNAASTATASGVNGGRDASAATAAVLSPTEEHLPTPSPSPLLSIPHETKLQLLQESEEERGLLNSGERKRNGRRKQTKGAAGPKDGRKEGGGGKHCSIGDRRGGRGQADADEDSSVALLPAAGVACSPICRLLRVQKATKTILQPS